MTCRRCDELLDELARTRDELGAVRENLSERTWERDHAIAGYRQVCEELRTVRLAMYAAKDDGRG